MTPIKAETPRSVKILRVIEVEAKRGSSEPGDPIRIVRQYYSLQGDLLAEHDPQKSSFVLDQPTTFEINFPANAGRCGKCGRLLVETAGTRCPTPLMHMTPIKELEDV